MYKPWLSHITKKSDFQTVHTMQLSKGHGNPCSKHGWYMKFKWLWWDLTVIGPINLYSMNKRPTIKLNWLEKYDTSLLTDWAVLWVPISMVHWMCILIMSHTRLKRVSDILSPGTFFGLRLLKYFEPKVYKDFELHQVFMDDLNLYTKSI